MIAGIYAAQFAWTSVEMPAAGAAVIERAAYAPPEALIYTTLEFFVALLFSCAALALARSATQKPLVYELTLLATNFLFLVLILNLDWQAAFALVVVAVACFAAAVGGRAARTNKQISYYAGLGLILVIFCVAKYALIASLPGFVTFTSLFAHLFGLRQPLALVGISYFTFKIIHFLVDVHQGSLENFRFLRYLNFVFFFPSFLSGPIDRYQTFSESVEKSRSFRLTLHEFCDLTVRFAVGLVKKVLVASVVLSLSVAEMAPETLADRSRWALLCGAYAYTLFIFFDLSGYTDMAIATGRLIGIRVPENFNFPFTSLSIQEYWNRYHLTLSHWIRDYLFFPTLRGFLTIFPRSKGPWFPALSVAIAFTLCGVWHGGNLHFLIYGLGHGSALGTYIIYSDSMKKYFKTFYKTLRANTYYKFGAWLLTMHFVAFNNTLFCENGFRFLKLFFMGGP